MYANDPRLDPRYQEQQDPRIMPAPPSPQPKESSFNPLMAAALGIGAIATGAAALRGRRGVQVTNLSKVPVARPVPAPDTITPPPPSTQARGMNTNPTRDLSPRVVSSGGVTAETFTPAEVQQMFGAPNPNAPASPHVPIRQPAPAPIQRVMGDDPRMQATLGKYGLNTDDLSNLPRAEVVSLHRESGIPLAAAPRFTPTPSPQLFNRDGVGYPSFKTEWGEIAGVQQPYPRNMLEQRGLKASDFQNERQTLGDINRTIELGLTKGQNAENIGDVYRRGTNLDEVYRPAPTAQRWTDQPLYQADVNANGGPAWVKGDDGILAIGERDRPVSQIMHDLDTEHGFKGAVDWRKMSSNMPTSDLLDAAPQWATRTQPMPQGREVDLFSERGIQSPYANDDVWTERKGGSFNMVTDATEKGDANWLKTQDISVPGVGKFPLTRGATVDVGGKTYARDGSDYFDMDALEAIKYKRLQVKQAGQKFLADINSPSVSPLQSLEDEKAYERRVQQAHHRSLSLQSLENQKAYELQRQGLTQAERDYASAYRQMEMPEQVSYRGRVSLTPDQAEPVKQYLASKGLQVDSVSFPSDPSQQHITFRGTTDFQTQLELQRRLGQTADREVLKLPPGYSVAPENVHGFAKLHPDAVPGQLYKGVEWDTTKEGKQFISKPGEPVLNAQGKPQMWQGQPIEVDASVDRPTVKAVPSAFRDVPTDIDPEWKGLRDQWKQERQRSNAAFAEQQLGRPTMSPEELRERAQALVARRRGQ